MHWRHLATRNCSLALYFFIIIVYISHFFTHINEMRDDSMTIKKRVTIDMVMVTKTGDWIYVVMQFYQLNIILYILFINARVSVWRN